MQTVQAKVELSFTRLIGVSMAAKLLVDIGTQIFNPFLPVIAAGLGMSVVELGRLVGLRSAMGVCAPVSGALADRYGYRPVIQSALWMSAAGFFLLGASSARWMVVLGMVLSGLGIGAFVPNLQAFVSSRLSYALRARGLGMIEYSWALTGILGLSLIGLLMAVTNWRVPFFLLAAGMIAMSFVFGAMPAARHPRSSAVGSDEQRAGGWLRKILGVLAIPSNRRSTYATIMAGALSYFAAMQVMIAHGAWLAQEYGLDAAALGLVAFVFGWFDLAASVAVSLFTDRIGKKRSVLIGVLGSLVGYLFMPFLNVGVIPAVAIIGIARMFFEFNIVSHFPLLSEQAPLHRGQTMTLGAAVSLVGATVAGFTGPWLLVHAGVTALAWSSAAIVTLSLAIVLFLVQERPGSGE
ncbi:MAG: MFS transporter [Caldilinea sp.]|nr:MFS transporter [Caldilinea sp.]MDW8442087.1 MFS transporter [Caldilineaceae bacterium]